MAGCECCDNFSMIDGGDEFKAFPGLKGEDGTTFYPHVSADGVLSWTNDGGKQNPDPVNIKGADGKSAYEAAVEAGFSGTEAEFNAYLSGIGDLTDEVADQKSALDDLTDLVDRKAGALIDTASGAIASFVPDATIDNLLGVTVGVEPVQDLHGYDAPWPAGGGKNLLQVTATTQTINGVTFAVNDDGTVLVNGTATANAVFILNSYDFDGTAVILNGCPSGGSVSTFKLDAFGASGLSEDIGSGVTISTSGTRDIRIVVFSGTTITNKLFTPMIRLASVTDATFAPYSNICPISGWTGAEVMRSGVNLIDDTLRNFTNTVLLNKGVWYAQAFVSGPSEINTRLQYFDKINNSWVDITALPQSMDDFTIIAITSQRNPFGWLYSNQTVQISIVNPTSFRFSVSSLNDTRRLSISPNQLSAFVEYENTDQISVTFPSSAGTVYGGTLDVTAGTMTVGKVNLVFSGEDEAWGFYISDGTTELNSFRLKLPSTIGTVLGAWASADAKNAICNIATASGDAVYNHSAIAFAIDSSQYVYVCLPVSSVADLKAFLSQTNLQICASLATPITITLDPVTISAISGQTNNVWADAGDVSVEYAADIKTYIDRLNQPTEDDMIANTLIAANKYFTVNNRLFLSTASIAAGAQIIPGTNCTETSLVEALNALNA